mmetsp:Transcript_55641/g.118332  ORF Transcript_55641/g.118332 Transcript_55641/m.118332 type:complete len:272 (+) Transcript_55641:1066-1881(+)
MRRVVRHGGGQGRRRHSHRRRRRVEPGPHGIDPGALSPRADHPQPRPPRRGTGVYGRLLLRQQPVAVGGAGGRVHHPPGPRRGNLLEQDPALVARGRRRLFRLRDRHIRRGGRPRRQRAERPRRRRVRVRLPPSRRRLLHPPRRGQRRSVRPRDREDHADDVDGGGEARAGERVEHTDLRQFGAGRAGRGGGRGGGREPRSGQRGGGLPLRARSLPVGGGGERGSVAAGDGERRRARQRRLRREFWRQPRVVGRRRAVGRMPVGKRLEGRG